MLLLVALLRHEEREAERIDRELDARDAAAAAQVQGKSIGSVG
jgi:hypothetical protein